MIIKSQLNKYSYFQKCIAYTFVLLPLLYLFFVLILWCWVCWEKGIDQILGQFFWLVIFSIPYYIVLFFTKSTKTLFITMIINIILIFWILFLWVSSM
jgi:hypothetical protein